MRVIAPLHGIRTTANWHRKLSDALQPVAGCQCDLERWYYGKFSLLRFLLPWQRSVRVKWFRETYSALLNDRRFDLGASNFPSMVAHSFGTYILGYALVRFPNIKLDRVILCGSILPKDFPWNELLERGQVNAVRNEYGTDDIWSNLVRWLVKGTGASGRTGFERKHARLFQEKFSFRHSEYFDRGHMSAFWIPFFTNPISEQPAIEFSVYLSKPNVPWGLYLIYATIFAILAALFIPWDFVTGRV